MKIDQINLQEITQQSGTMQHRGAQTVVLADLTGKETDPLHGHAPQVQKGIYEKPGNSHVENIADQMAVASDMAAVRHQEMAVLSNTMSGEDFKEYQENGYSLHGIDTKDMLTVIDKIKIQLAKSGEDVGEISVSDEVLREVAGPQALQAISDSFAAQDLPLTEENRKDTVKALEFAGALTEFPDASVKYMMDKALPPTIENLTIARSAGTAPLANAMEQETFLALQDRIEEVISETGLPVSEETLDDSRFMLENEIPLTKDHLTEVHELRTMELPFSAGEVLTAAAAAVKDGKRPMDADILSLRRNRVEAQLVMTADGRNQAEKLGVKLDLTALEGKADLLKEEEKRYTDTVLRQADAPVTPENEALFEETEQKLAELKAMPAAALAIPAAGADTLESLHETGAALQQKYEQAQEAYETMGTEVRKDLGDSIQKAFRSVDTLLEELRLPVTEFNQRAVRILGYNSMEITPENIAAVKLRDAEVQTAFRTLTPVVVADFIKNGENPLKLEMSELTSRAQEAAERVGVSEDEKYSAYLVKLEANGDITPEERDSYIGIYRLIHQIEESDGAAIGALVEQGAPITMKNLLGAVRTAKRGAMDYTVDDDFGGVRAEEKTRNILEQAETVFQRRFLSEAADALSPESVKTALNSGKDWQESTPEEFLSRMREADTAKEDLEYQKAVGRELSSAAMAEEEVYRALDRLQVPNTLENVQVMQQMMTNPNAAMRKLFGMKDPAYYDEDGKVDFEAVKADLLRQFGEAADTPEDMAKAQKALYDVAENVMKTMLSSEETKTALDVRELRLMTGQFRLGVRAAQQQEYHIPIQVQGETGEMTLKIVNGTEKKGMVDIMFQLSSTGAVAAKLKLEEQRLTGYIAAEKPETTAFFREHEEAFSAPLGETQGISDVRLSFVEEEGLDLNRFWNETQRQLQGEASENPEGPSTRTLYRVAKTFLQLLNDFS